MKQLFERAVVRLTVSYVLILATVCILFSAFIYQLASYEIDDSSKNQVVGFRNMLGRFVVDEERSEKLREFEASEARSRLKAKLLLANAGVIAAGTLVSYWFAKRTLDPIEASVKMQERFTSDASHELRTPLAVMRSEIEVALRDKNLSSAEARDLLVSNLEEVNSLHSITDNLLLLARNKELQDYKTVDIAKVSRTAAKKYIELAKNKKITISFDTQKSLVYTSKNAVQQICGILVDNAVKYSPEKSVITVKVIAKKNSADLYVDDMGIGIDKEFIAVMFDRFTRQDYSRTSQKTQGQGLGLSIARQLADAIGAKISVSSKVGKGTIFKVHIPSVQS